MNFQDNKIFHQNLSQESFALEESFHCSWEKWRRRGYHPSGPAIWLHCI